MLKKIFKNTIFGALPLTLAACGGGNSNSTDDTSNNIPVAVSGVDQNVLTGQTVKLDGSSSYDPDNDEISYLWSLNQMPSESEVSLDNPNSVKPSFVPDVEGIYSLNLTVYDGKDYSTDDSVVITVTTANTVPVSNAGSNQGVATQTVVTLDGSLSSDADGDNLSYFWALDSKPEGSSSQLNNPTSVKPTFTPDLDGQYEFSLAVNDGQNNSERDFVTVISTSANSAPIANAGTDRDVNTYEVVYLNGSNSSDANGDSLTYSWSFVSKPEGSSATLQNSAASTANFTPDIDGDYTISLIVNDGSLSSNPDNVVISASTANSAPTANAGSDQVQFDLTDVTLNGSTSSDADGDSLNYQWSIQSTPTGSSVSLANANAEITTFSPDLYGDYVFSLVVNDGVENSATDNVIIQVIDPAQKQDYLASNISAYNSMTSASSVNGYVQSGSQYVLNVTNNNNQTVGWSKLEVTDANGVVFVSSTDSSVLSNGSLTSGESSSVQITLQSSQKSPFVATFYWTDPLDSDKPFETTLEFANR